MYHTDKINQAPIEKNLKQTRFSSENLQTAHFTQAEEVILKEILKHAYDPYIHLKNNTLALRTGYSNKTVTRATNKFHKYGLITKHQENKYAPNYYTPSEKVKRRTFSHWFNSLSDKNQYLYNSHGIRIDHKNKIIYSLGNVPQNKKSSLILDSLFINSCVVVSSRTGAEDRIHIQNKSNQKKGRTMNAIQKQLILDNRYDPRVKDMLNNPEIMAHVITPIIQKITTLLTLDEKEQFKLTAFTDETLEYVYEKIEVAIKNKQVPHVPNRMEWLILFATQYCNNNHIKPDWRWYYNLCDIIGIDPRTKPKPWTDYKLNKLDLVASFPEVFKKKITKEQRRLDLMNEIEICTTKLGDPHKYFNDFCFEESIVHFENRLAGCLQELTELEQESNEKQNISNQRVTNSLEPCSA